MIPRKRKLSTKETLSHQHSLGIYNELVPLDGEDHGAWDAVVDGQGLFEMCFDFVVSRQGLRVE